MRLALVLSVALAGVLACGSPEPAPRPGAEGPTSQEQTASAIDTPSESAPTPVASLKEYLRGDRIPDQGRTHIAWLAPHPPYNSVPATSGWHFRPPFAPAFWGIFTGPLPDEVLVHNLEHAGVGIHYNCPDGCEELVTQLIDIVRVPLRKRLLKIIIAPYPDMDTRIALTAWNYLDKFEEFDELRIRAFILEHEKSGNAPEHFKR